jgi:hypothetical protein
MWLTRHSDGAKLHVAEKNEGKNQLKGKHSSSFSSSSSSSFFSAIREERMSVRSFRLLSSCQFIDGKVSPTQQEPTKGNGKRGFYGFLLKSRRG